MFLRAILANYVRQSVQAKILQSVAELSSSGLEGEGDDSTDAVDQHRFSVAILFGLSVESGGFLDLMQGTRTAKTPLAAYHAGLLGEHRVLVCETGTGLQAAANATIETIHRFAPDWIIAAGFASGLSDVLRRRSIIMPHRICSEEFGELAIALKYDPQQSASDRGYHVGRLISTNRELRTADEKRALARKSDSIACDLESFAVANVCQLNKTRFIAARVIIDAVDDELPKDVQLTLNQKTVAGKLGAVTGALFNRFSTAKDLWNLKEEGLMASDRLAKFLSAIVPTLIP